jgi:hypothetical protein
MLSSGVFLLYDRESGHLFSFLTHQKYCAFINLSLLARESAQTSHQIIVQVSLSQFLHLLYT